MCWSLGNFRVVGVGDSSVDNRTYVGIDNGVTGSISILNKGWMVCYPMPVKKTKNYQKGEGGYIHRVDRHELIDIFRSRNLIGNDVCFMVERPMVNPGRTFATYSALRSFEVLLTVLEEFDLKFVVVDSREWQGYLVSRKISGDSDDLKGQSKEMAYLLYPDIDLSNVNDGDSVMLAHYLMLKTMALGGMAGVY